MPRSTLTRREFAASFAALAALVGTPRWASAKPEAPKRRVAGPSKLVVIHQVGGSDDMYTCDPRLKPELKKGMGPGWEESQIARQGTLRLAPPWEPLKPFMPRMQVLLGVQVFSVAHESAGVQMAQMRTRIGNLTEPAFLTLAGQALAPHADVPALTLDRAYYASRGKLIVDFHAKMLQEFQKTANDPALYETALAVLKGAACSGSDCDTFKATHALMTKLHGHPTITPPTRKIDPKEWPATDRLRMVRRFNGIDYSWAEFLLKEGLASAVAINPYGVFDTHVTNELNGAANHQLALSLRELMDNLAKLPGQNGGATLLDETGFVILGELGRFPYINTNMGKDHFPQISVTLIGPGLKQGTFGETNREMVGQKISFSTGKPGKDGALMTLDDVGRSLLEWVGHPSPEAYGYDGRLLEFMFA